MDESLVLPAGNASASLTPDEQWCEAIAARIHRGDLQAENDLAQRFQPGLMLVLRRVCAGDRDQAHDLCQDTLLIVLQRLRSRPLEDPSRLAAFAAQTARNLALAELRKVVRRRTDTGFERLDQFGDPAAKPVEAISSAASAQAVREMLTELSNPRDRDLLERYYVHDQDKATICRDMDLPLTLFNQVLFRARRRFREILESRGFRRQDFI